METIIALLISLLIVFNSPDISAEQKRLELDRVVPIMYQMLEQEQAPSMEIAEPTKKVDGCVYKGKRRMTCV